MALYWQPGVGVVDDQTTDIPWYGELPLPDGSAITWGQQGIERLPEYTLGSQFASPVQWRSELGGGTPQGVEETYPGYITQVLQWADAAQAGQLKDYENEQWQELQRQARAVPLRDPASLYAGYTARENDPSGANWLGFGSPDLGHFLLTTRERIAQGTASPQERATFDELARMGADWNYRASVPQESDRFSPISNEFFLALGALGGAVGGAGAFGAFAPVAGAGAAGAASASAATPSLLGIPTSTLSTLGAIGSYGGTGLGVLGQATGQDWLSKAGLGLGILGGLAGGAAGIGNVLGTSGSGVQNLTDAARLAQSVGRVGGALGTASGSDALRQASSYLRLGGQLGNVAGGTLPTSLTDWSTQRGGPMAEWYDWEYTDPQASPYDDWSWDAGATAPSGWEAFTGWGTPYGPGSSGDPAFAGDGAGGGLGSLQDQVSAAIASRPDLYGAAATPQSWLGSALGALGSIGGFLGKNAGLLGPAVSTLGALGGGALGANASSDAARLQTAALNRGLDLQTAQWLQTQANQAPWLQAGQQGLEELRWRLGHEQMTPPEARAAVRGADYALPTATPGWTPSQYAGYTPTAVPSAAGYQYTPGQYLGQAGAMPDTGFQYTNQLPTQGFTAPSWDALKARDPGIAARLEEARQAVEGSAAARGGALSGPALAALGRQAQTLASQEYAPAYQRALGEYQMGYGQDWQRQQEAYQRALAQNELRYGRGWQQYLQGWGQGLTREQLAQQASAQNWGQAVQEAQLRAQQQQFGWQAGFQGQQQGQREREAYDTALYNRLLQQNQLQYGRDVYTNETEEQRRQQVYNQQLAEMVRQWNQAAGLAQVGQLSAGTLGQLGQANTQQQNALLTNLGLAQGQGALSQGNAWSNALGNVNTGIQGGLGTLAFQQGIQSLLSRLNM